MILIKIFALCVITDCMARPATDEERKKAHKALYNRDMLNGDIMIDITRNAVPSDKMLWTNGVVPYIIDGFSAKEKDVIQKGMNDIMTKTCIKFKQRTTEKNYIRIFKGQGCYSYVGCLFQGQQDVSLGDGCVYVGTVVHELLHAVGFYHEHDRSDRDNYIYVYPNNAQAGAQSQFKKMTPQENRILAPYSIDSIMHYGNYAFSKDGKSKTIEAKNGKPISEPYDKPGSAPTDAQRVKVLYKCP